MRTGLVLSRLCCGPRQPPSDAPRRPKTAAVTIPGLIAAQASRNCSRNSAGKAVLVQFLGELVRTVPGRVSPCA